MEAPNDPFRFEWGNLRLVEVEHLFGWDLVMSRIYDEEAWPIAILVRKRQMDAYERILAVQWLGATLAENYPKVSRLVEELALRGDI